MTSLQIAFIMGYILVGLFLADIFLVKVDLAYWVFLIFYPIIIVVFFTLLIGLSIVAKLYELEEKIK